VDEAPCADQRTLPLRERAAHGHRPGAAERDLTRGDDLHAGAERVADREVLRPAVDLLGTAVGVAHTARLLSVVRRPTLPVCHVCVRSPLTRVHWRPWEQRSGSATTNSACGAPIWMRRDCCSRISTSSCCGTPTSPSPTSRSWSCCPRHPIAGCACATSR